MAITLGKDATLTVGGAIGSVRNVQWSASARTIDVEEYGQRQMAAYSIGWEASVSFEFLDGTDLDAEDFYDGALVAVSGGAGGWSFNAIVTSISETNPIDGVTAYQVECRLTRSGLR